MQTKFFCVVVALTITTATAWSEPLTGNPASELKQLEAKAADVKSGKAAEFAPDALIEALTSVSTAQTAAAGGNQKLVRQKVEMSSLLLDIAGAKAGERELLEQVAVRRVELKKLEAQLEQNLQGEVKP
jgi:hypothetical protein